MGLQQGWDKEDSRPVHRKRNGVNKIYAEDKLQRQKERHVIQ